MRWPALRLLLAHGAELEAEDFFRVTPLIDAVNGGHLAVVRLLVRAGANVNAAQRSGDTALQRAIAACSTVELDYRAACQREGRPVEPKALAAIQDRFARIVHCLIRAGAEKFGSQCIVVSIDTRRTGPETWTVFSHGGRRATGWEAVAWARRAVELGAGEIVLNSIDADGTKQGYDLGITRRISEAVPVPVVASGGAGHLDHLVEVLRAGKADAVLAASIFHEGTYTVGEVKRHLRAAGIPVRLPPSA